MIEEVFHIGSFSVSPFGVMLALAFLAAYTQMRWGFRVVGAGTEDDATALLVASAVGGVLGGKVYFAILYGDWHLLFDRSGLVWYGGFLLGTVSVIWVLRRRHLRIWPTLDAVAPALALGYAVGRIGCFLVGDDYGVPTELPWGVRFRVGPSPSTAHNLHDLFGVALPPGVADAAVLAVHPTQLYETFLALLIWAFGAWQLRRRERLGLVVRTTSGMTGLAVLALLACERFGVQFLRAKDDRSFGHLTLAQVISLEILMVLLLFWHFLRRDSARRPAANPESSG